jgi:small subunit ribosomal protein S2
VLTTPCAVEFFSGFGSTATRDNTWQPHHSLHRPAAPRDLTLNALVASGAHLGHSQKLMNPNFAAYAYGERAGVTIIDVEQTLALLRRAAAVVRGILARDGLIVFVGTRRDIAPAVRKAAARLPANAYFVDKRWLPGSFTNRAVLHGLDALDETRLIPDAVVFLNPIANVPALRECALENVPTIGIIDSNVDPRIVMYPIPANDESVRTAELIAGVLSIAAREGFAMREVKKDTAAALPTENTTEGTQEVEERVEVSDAERAEAEAERAARLADLQATDPLAPPKTAEERSAEHEATVAEMRRNEEEIAKMKALALADAARGQEQALDALEEQRAPTESGEDIFDRSSRR